MYCITLKVHIPNILVLGIWEIVSTVQVWGKYMIIGYLDPEGKRLQLQGFHCLAVFGACEALNPEP